jgi:hypothetical protein
MLSGMVHMYRIYLDVSSPKCKNRETMKRTHSNAARRQTKNRPMTQREVEKFVRAEWKIYCDATEKAENDEQLKMAKDRFGRLREHKDTRVTAETALLLMQTRWWRPARKRRVFASPASIDPK